MKNKKSIAGERKLSFSVLDVFFLLLIVVCAVSVIARYVLTDENGILAVTPPRTNAAVQILITGIEIDSSDHFSEDAEFTVGDTGETGKLTSVTVQPAEYYTENEKGELEIAYEDGENGRRDVRCTVVVGGYYRDGIFLLGGEEPMIPGGSVTMSGGSITVTALIIDTAPIEG